MDGRPACVIALWGIGLALSLSGLRRVALFKAWLPLWLPYLLGGVALGLAGGTAVMRFLNYRI